MTDMPTTEAGMTIVIMRKETEAEAGIMSRVTVDQMTGIGHDEMNVVIIIDLNTTAIGQIIHVQNLELLHPLLGPNFLLLLPHLLFLSTERAHLHFLLHHFRRLHIHLMPRLFQQNLSRSLEIFLRNRSPHRHLLRHPILGLTIQLLDYQRDLQCICLYIHTLMLNHIFTQICMPRDQMPLLTSIHLRR